MDPRVIGLIVVILLVVGFMAYRSMSGEEDPELSQAASPAGADGDAVDQGAEAVAEAAQVDQDAVVPEGAETIEEPVNENEPSVGSPKDVNGLVGWYTGDSWDEEKGIWVDLSDAKNDATEVKGSIITDTSNFANNNKFLIGGVDAGIRFPQECMSTGRKYTMITVARYNGSARQRIFDGVGGNFFSGFHGGYTGGAHRDGSYWIAWSGHASDSDKQSQKFIVHTDMKAMIRRNGIRRSGLTNYRGIIPRQMSINYGDSSEKSDWAVAEVMFFKGELPASEYKKIETYLFKKYMIAREIRPRVHTAQAWTRYENFGSLANTGFVCGDEGMLNNNFLIRHKEDNEWNQNFDFRGDCVQGMEGGIEEKNGQLIQVGDDDSTWWQNYEKLVNFDCKDKAISGYQFDAVGDKNIRSKYSCHNAPLNKQSCYTKETSVGPVSASPIEALDMSKVGCDSVAQAMTKMELVTEDGQVKYKYRCCNLEDL